MDSAALRDREQFALFEGSMVGRGSALAEVTGLGGDLGGLDQLGFECLVGHGTHGV